MNAQVIPPPKEGRIIASKCSSKVREILDEWDTILDYLGEEYPKTGTTEISLKGQGFTGMLPPHIAHIYPQLEKLDLSGNYFLALPLELQNLPLKELNLTGNDHLEKSLDAPLRWLNKIPGIKIIPERLLGRKKPFLKRAFSS